MDLLFICCITPSIYFVLETIQVSHKIQQACLITLVISQKYDVNDVFILK